MPNKGRKRRFNLRKVKVASAVAAGALAAGDVISTAVTNDADNTLRFISLDCSYSWSNIGAIIDDAATFGVAHSDYTAAEVEECLEAATSMDIGDKVAQEQANRLVREIGTISGFVGTAAAGASFNDGKKFKTRLNWLMAIGDTLNLWIRNSSGTVWTTGSSLTINGELWVKD